MHKDAAGKKSIFSSEEENEDCDATNFIADDGCLPCTTTATATATTHESAKPSSSSSLSTSEAESKQQPQTDDDDSFKGWIRLP